MRRGLTFDDVLLVPQPSSVATRQDVDLTTHLGSIELEVPIISANMDTVTWTDMAMAMDSAGGLGILHRFAPHEEVVKQMGRLIQLGHLAIPSIGIKEDDIDKALDYHRAGAQAICVDVAHGGMDRVVDIVLDLKLHGIKNVIAGNVATYETALALVEAGADAIKVGVGSGGACLTRCVTGHGVPQLTAIMECAKVKDMVPHDVAIIADGGIRGSADICKALAAGADAVMIGSLLAPYPEAPGRIKKLQDGSYVKQYRGMASRSAQRAHGVARTPEGDEMYLPFIDRPVRDFINELADGIRSGFSYSGAHNLKEFQMKADFIEVTGATIVENGPHARTRS